MNHLPLAFVASSLALAPTASAGENWDFDASELDHVVVDLDVGDAKIRAGTSVSIQVKADGDDCEVHMDRDGRTARLELEVGRHHGDCDRIEIELILPPTVAGRVTTGAGDIDLEGVAAPLELETGAGDIEGRASHVVEAKSGAGDVELHDLTQPIRVKSGAGDIELQFAGVVHGEIRATTGVGDVHIRLANDDPVDAVVRSGMGRTRVRLAQAAGAPTVIEARSGVGNVDIDS